MRALLPLIAVLMPLAAGSGRAADPSGFALVGVRLHMHPDEVGAVLRQQSKRVIAQRHPCKQSAGACTTTITAQVPDGLMEVQFAETATGGEEAWQIRLIITGRGAGDQNLIRGAAIAHYGIPTTDLPAWCRPDASLRACQAGAPSLVLESRESAAGVFTLTDPALAAP